MCIKMSYPIRVSVCAPPFDIVHRVSNVIKKLKKINKQANSCDGIINIFRPISAC